MGDTELEQIREQMRQDTLALMDEIVQEFGPVSIDELAVRLTPPVPTTQIEDWRHSRRIFSVPYRGQDLYPAFQFEDGRPKGIVAAVLELLQGKALEEGSEIPYSDWDALCWFVSANGWLGGKLPIEMMDSEPNRLVKAATQARMVD